MKRDYVAFLCFFCVAGAVVFADFQFGYNTCSKHLEWFADQNYSQPYVQARLEQDIAMASSLKGCAIRFNVWPYVATYLDSSKTGKEKWVFSPDFYEIVDNTVDWLAGMGYDHKIRVVIAFHNTWFTDEHYANVGMTLDEVKERSKEWMAAFINAIEADPKASQVVFGYDYQNEVWSYTPNIVSYMQYLVANVPVPSGKRVLSISYKQDGTRSDWVSWWSGQLSGSFFNYVDLHFYPDVQSYDTPSNLSSWVSKARSAYPNATIYMGEYGYKGGGSFPGNEGSGNLTEDNMSFNMVNLAINAQSNNLMFHMGWDMVPVVGNTEPAYGMFYKADQPKNVIGSLSAASVVNTLTNPDAESASGGQPTGWTGYSNIGFTLSRQGPNKSNAAANSYFGRISMNSGNSSDWATIEMSPMTITQTAGVHYNLYVNAFLRSNMKVKVSMLEYNQSGTFIRQQDWMHGLVDLLANTWQSTIYVDPYSMPWVPPLHQDTRTVRIQFTGFGKGSNPSVLDVDAVSAAIRAADRVLFPDADFDHSGLVDGADMQKFASEWLAYTKPAYLSELKHRYTFDGNCNDSVDKAHGSLVASSSSFYEWGTGYLWLKNGTAQKNDYSGGGAYVDLPDYMLNNLRNANGITLEMFVSTVEPHWWSGYLTFGAGNPNDGISDALAVTSYENKNSYVVWKQEAGYWGHRVQAPSNLDNATHFAVVVDNAQNYVAFYIDGLLANYVLKSTTPWEMPGLNISNDTYQDTVNYIGRYYEANNPMLNANIYAVNIYSKALSQTEVADSYANGPDRLCERKVSDFDDNCTVDIRDFAIFADQWLTGQ